MYHDGSTLAYNGGNLRCGSTTKRTDVITRYGLEEITYEDIEFKESQEIGNNFILNQS